MRLRIGRAHPAVPSPQPLDVTMLARTATARHYRDGVKDGMGIALRMITGTASHGGEPYRGPLPDELRAYVERALKRLEGGAS